MPLVFSKRNISYYVNFSFFFQITSPIGCSLQNMDSILHNLLYCSQSERCDQGVQTSLVILETSWFVLFLKELQNIPTIKYVMFDIKLQKCKTTTWTCCPVTYFIHRWWHDSSQYKKKKYRPSSSPFSPEIYVTHHFALSLWWNWECVLGRE